MRRLTLFGVLWLLAGSAWAQSVNLNTVTRTGTISANGGSVELTVADLGGGGMGSVKVQTLDSYSGTWEVQCSVDGTTYDTASELKLTASDSTTVVYNVTDTVAIYDVGNAFGCQKIKVIATAGFAASDVAIAISATQSGGGGGASGGGAGGAVTVTDGVETALVDAGGQLLVTCADCSGTGVSHVDDAAFTAATDDVVPVGGVFDDTSPDSVNEGDAGAVRMSANRNLYSTLRDAAGNERGANVDASNRLMVFAAATDLDVQSGGADILSTTAFNAALGTAGTADAQVLSIQGIASMTPVSVQSAGADLATESGLQDLLTAVAALEAAINTDVTHDVAAGTAGPQNMCIGASTTPTAVTDGDAVREWCDLQGRLHVTTEGIEDTTETAGGPLNMVGAVVRATAAGSTATGGENATVNVDTLGRMWMRQGGPCEDHARITSAAIDTASSGNVEIVALNGSDLVYICALDVVVDAAVDIQLIYGTGTACATGETNLTGPWGFAANGGIIKPKGVGPYFVVPAGNAFCIETSGAVQTSGSVSYVRTPAP